MQSKVVNQKLAIIRRSNSKNKITRRFIFHSRNSATLRMQKQNKAQKSDWSVGLDSRSAGGRGWIIIHHLNAVNHSCGRGKVMNDRLRSGGLYIILPAIELDLRGVERAFQWQFSTMTNKTIRSTQFERRQDAKTPTLLAPQPLWGYG